jgi:capsular exopolysaccharide synthesis family protein
LLLIVWREFRIRRINSASDVVDNLGLNLMGTLPALPRRRMRWSLTTASDESLWQCLLTESVDAFRTMLLHATRPESLQVLMVTSAMGGEGKTSLSTQIAVSLSRAGRKVLLVDCDLRNPAVHRLFGLSRGPGLCEVLRGEIEFKDVIQETAADHLWVAPAGQFNLDAVQALARTGLKKFLAQARGQYDFVIIDSCPVLPVADTLLVAQYVDAVIFSILQDVSRLPKVYDAYRRLATLGTRMLGAVVLGTQEEMHGSVYQYMSPQAVQAQ